MTPEQALHEILAQHDALCARMDRCDQLADALDATQGSPSELLAEVARLREDFEAHTRFEERVLRPVLRETGLVAHVGEHRAMHVGLAPGPTGELRATIAALREHLTTEEHYFSRRSSSSNKIRRGGVSTSSS